MIFLGTPHRGADSAQMLNNILRASFSHGSKAYVNDLAPDSGALQAINDEFRHVHQGLQLWSFFETVPTNLGISNNLIVQKDSAVMGEKNTSRCSFHTPNAFQDFLMSMYSSSMQTIDMFASMIRLSIPTIKPFLMPSHPQSIVLKPIVSLAGIELVE
jgi:hypothetical protein